MNSIIENDSSVTRKRRSAFATTSWTIIARAIDSPTDRQMAAMETLCIRYRPPVLSYLRQRVANGADADDLAQQFFVHLLTRDVLSEADAERGKFRTFLLTCLKNFVAKEFKRLGALKRGGGIAFSTVDEHEIAQAEEAPDRAFDRKWAETVLSQALTSVEDEWRTQGKPFDELKEYLLTPKSATPVVKKADQLNLSVAALKSAIYRLRQRYGAAVREVIAATLGQHQNVEDELATLMAILSE